MPDFIIVLVIVYIFLGFCYISNCLHLGNFSTELRYIWQLVVGSLLWPGFMILTTFIFWAHVVKRGLNDD